MKYVKSMLCFNKKFLIYNLVKRNIKIKYRESFLGYLWTMAIPTCQIAIFYFIYVVIFKVTVPNYLLFLVSGLLPWIFFSTTLTESMDSISTNSMLLNQMPIPIQVFPNAAAITNMVNYLSAFPIAALVYITSAVDVHWSLLLTIPLTACLYFMSLSLGIIFAVFYIYLRDLKHVTALFMQIWFYATPVIYSVDMVPERYAKYLFTLNPLASFFIVFRSSVFNEPVDLKYYAIFLIWTATTILLSVLVMEKLGRGVIERL